jgi:putative membrane protein
MHRTRDGTGVLLYIAPAQRKVAVYAGPGVHGAAKRGFWQHVVDAIARKAAHGDLTGGIVDALGRIGDLLRTHAPGDDSAGNELPDEVSSS